MWCVPVFRTASSRKYEISLFDPVDKAWQTVVIDEFIPCVKQNEEPKAAFSYPVGEELWAP